MTFYSNNGQMVLNASMLLVIRAEGRPNLCLTVIITALTARSPCNDVTIQTLPGIDHNIASVLHRAASYNTVCITTNAMKQDTICSNIFCRADML